MMGIADLLARAAPFRRALLAISALTIAESFALLALPWLGGKVLGMIVAGGGPQMAEVVALLVLTLALLTALNIAAAMLSARTAGQVLAGLRVEAYVHVQRLGIAFHDSSRQGDLLALMTFEVTNLSQFLTATLASVPAMVLTAIGAVLLVAFGAELALRS